MANTDPIAGTSEFEEAYPTQEELSADIVYNKALGRASRESFDKAQMIMIETSVALSKWILTSLLAVNAGGAVAVAQLDLQVSLKVLAGSCFVVGLTLPLIIAIIAIKNGQALAVPIGDAMGYWHKVEHNGARDRNAELQIFRIKVLSDQAKIWPNRLGVTSTLLFIAGCAVVGIGLWCGLPRPAL